MIGTTCGTGKKLYHEVAHIIAPNTNSRVAETIPYFIIADDVGEKAKREVQAKVVTAEQYWTLVRENKMSDFMTTIDNKIELYYTPDQLKHYKKAKVPIFDKMSDYFGNDMSFNVADISDCNPTISATYYAICPIMLKAAKILNTVTYNLMFSAYRPAVITDSELEMWQANLRSQRGVNAVVNRVYKNMIGVVVSFVPYQRNTTLDFLRQYYGVCLNYLTNSDARVFAKGLLLGQVPESYESLQWFFNKQ